MIRIWAFLLLLIPSVAIGSSSGYPGHGAGVVFGDGPRGEEPVFDLTFTTPSVSKLPINTTLNSETVTPSWIYHGGDADSSGWAPSSGSGTLTRTSVATQPTYNNGSPLLGSLDDSVKFNKSDYYSAPDSSSLTFTDDDFRFVILFRTGDQTTTRYIAGSRSSGAGFQFSTDSGGRLIFLLSDGTNSVQVQTSPPILSANSWYFAEIYVNRSENSTNGGKMYINGSQVGSANFNAVGDATNANNAALGAFQNGGSATDVSVAYLGLWEQDDWFQEGASGPTEWLAYHKENYHKMVGTYPTFATGTALPTSYTRSTSGMLRKYNSSESRTELYLAGKDWPRVEKFSDFTGFLSEQSKVNLLLQSEDFSTSWTAGNATITTNTQTAPDLSVTGDSLISSDAVSNADHFLSQAVTLTAATYSWSVFLKEGETAWAALWGVTGSDIAYYNLNTCAVGTTAGVTEAWAEDYGNGWCRVGYSFTGTAAAHTLRIHSAEADNDTTYVGDGTEPEIYTWGAQIELNEYMTSYFPTKSSTATRNPDILYYKGDDGNIDNGGTGSFVCKFRIPDYSDTQQRYLFDLTDGGSANDRISGVHSSSKIQVTAKDGGSTVASVPSISTVSDNATHTVSAQWETNLIDVVLDGVGAAGPDTSNTIPNDLDQIRIGVAHSGGSGLNANINYCRAYSVNTETE